jgi:hypothetical protein
VRPIAEVYNRAVSQPPVSPSIVRVVEPATPDMSYAGILLSAVGLVGVVLLAALVVGVLTGGLFILWRKRRDERDEGPPDRGVSLDLSSPS